MKQMANSLLKKRKKNRPFPKVVKLETISIHANKGWKDLLFELQKLMTLIVTFVKLFSI